METSELEDHKARDAEIATLGSLVAHMARSLSAPLGDEWKRIFADAVRVMDSASKRGHD